MRRRNKSGNRTVYERLLRGMIVLFIVFAVTSLTGCDDKTEPAPVLKITGISIPSTLDTSPGSEITITGKGFMEGDIIRITLKSDTSVNYTAEIISVTGNTATFILPANVSSSKYRLSVERESQSLLLGEVTFNIIADIVIPDIAGKTIKGVVYCDGTGIPGVVVSDGIEVTVTDSQGVYYLASQKKTGFVFISVPGDYEVATIGKIPQFFKSLAGGTTIERKDFSLFHSDNSKYAVVAMADMHLANRNDDIAQFGNGFLADVNSLISSYSSSGTKVYGLTLGDMTWDAYWYENNYSLPNYLSQMNLINCNIFNIMGNHDNDPYFAGDFPAEAKFRSTIGPTYYSFNLGSVHYVVLDDIQYVNTGGAQGVVGARDYYELVVTDQMTWLTRDLAAVSDKAKPLIIAMHSPLYGNPTLDGTGNQVDKYDLGNASSLVSVLQDFTNVHILSGHTHINYTVNKLPAVIEHNTAAVSATWWWTGKSGYAGNHICKDGSPGGYGLLEVNGSNVRWYFKSIGKNKNYQFRTYDLNQVLINASAFAPNSTDAALAPYAGVYATANTGNEVLINVWGWDPQWSIEVKEGTTILPVTRVYAMDPLHIISYEAKRLNAGSAPTSSFLTCSSAHMFKVAASGPATTLTIKVTDRYGNVYNETMTRPKTFTYLME